MDKVMQSLLDANKYVDMNCSGIHRFMNQGEEISENPGQIFDEEMLQQRQKYDGMSKTRKYGSVDTYRQFREELLEIRNPVNPAPTNLFDDEDEEGDDDSEGDDLVVGSTRISLKCPLTATWLEDPVTNRSCGHSYSKQAVADHVRHSHRGQSVRCPLSGCSSNLVLNNLVPNKSLQRRVERHLRKLEAATSATQDQVNITHYSYHSFLHIHCMTVFY